MKSQRRLTAFLPLIALLLLPVTIFSCSQYIPTIFVSKNAPDFPSQPYNDGKLGILWPGFQRRYLVIAYRYLQQHPLTRQEQQSLNEEMRPRIVPADQYDPDPPETAWLKARSDALGMNKPEKNYVQRMKILGFSFYPNCGDDSFFNAARTAKARAHTFGVGSAAMRDWVAGQDAVFLNCGSADDLRYYPPDEKRPPAQLHLPSPVNLDNAVLKYDRQYQVAAANFYFGNFDTATADFEKIAQEPNSPWRTLAPYLIARAYIRKATVDTTGEAPFAPEYMRDAEQRLQAILADKSLGTMYPAARSLLDYVEARLHPEQRLHAIASKLATDAGSQFARDLYDYTYLLDHVLDDESNSPEVKQAVEAKRGTSPDLQGIVDEALVEAWRSAAKKADAYDNLTDWVLSWQTSGVETAQHRLQRWQGTNELPWMLSVLATTKPGDTYFTQVNRAAEGVTPDSPAYDTALYHRVRLLLVEDKQEQARKLLNANLERIEQVSPSARNAFLAQRLAVATDYQEFLRFAPRTPVELQDYIGTTSYVCMNGTCADGQALNISPPPPRLELDSIDIFNQRLPLNMLAQAAVGTTLPGNLRDQLAARTWVRAAILDDVAIARELQPMVAGKYPEFRPYLEQFGRADTVEARRFALVFMVMHFAGMQPFVNAGPMGSVIAPGIHTGSAWWCYDVGQEQTSRAYQSAMFSQSASPLVASTTPSVAAPSWLATGERQRGAAEWKKLSTTGAAPLYFAPIVLNWAKQHPDDPRVPEALHYFVRASRFGCVDKTIGPYSKQAFDLLHKRYPQSDWTAKTLYWFG